VEGQENDPNLMRLSEALGELRDSWVKMSMTLRDLQYELDSYRRDEVMTEVERYLARLSESSRGEFD
jgi:hypothetical protein